MYNYTQKLSPERIACIKPQQDDHKIQMVAAKAEE